MPTVKKQAISGMIWASLGGIGGGVINLLVIFILARLLEPSDFGVLELLAVVTSISTVLVDSGFSQALIRDKNANIIDKSTVFYINILISTFLYVLLFLTAPLIANFFHLPAFVEYSRVAFLCIIFDSFSVIQNINYTKELNFKPIAISTLAAIILSGVITIFLSWLDFGTWSLVVFILTNSLLKTFFLWIQCKWRPIFIISTESLRKYWKFGSFILVQSLVDKIAMDIESVVIGRVYTKAQLGFFSQSRKINSYFGQALTSVVVKVSYPLLVKIGDTDEQLKNGYRKIVGYTTFVTSPIMVFIFCFPYETMGALFGDKWVSAGEYLRLWSCIGLIQPILAVCNNVFLVKGKSKSLLYISAIKNILKVIVVVSLVSSGIYSILFGIVIVFLFTALLFLYFSGKLIHYRLTSIFKDVFPNVITAFLSCLIPFTITNVFDICKEYPFFHLILLFLCFLFAYIILNVFIGNKNLKDIIYIAKSYMHR